MDSSLPSSSHEPPRQRTHPPAASTLQIHLQRHLAGGIDRRLLVRAGLLELSEKNQRERAVGVGGGKEKRSKTREKSSKNTHQIPVLGLLIKQLARLAHGHADEAVLAGAAAHAAAAHAGAAAAGVVVAALRNADVLARYQPTYT